MIPSLQVSDDVHFLVDTGADSTLLAPADALFLRVDAVNLPQGTPSIGVGGVTATAWVEASLTFGRQTHEVRLRLLIPASPRQRRTLLRIPSLLGRDVLARLALFMEERTGRVLLLEPAEADAVAFS